MAILMLAGRPVELAFARTSTPAEPAIVAGMPLTEALQRLRAAGLDLIWSSLLVGPELLVVTPPAPGATPRDTLDQVLAPHGLTAEGGPGGTLVLRATSASAPLLGEVRSRRALAPVPGAVVRVVENGHECVTGSDGRFTLSGMADGTYTLEARRPGFVIERLTGVTVGPSREPRPTLALLLQPAPLASEEITIHPSAVALLDEDPVAPVALSRREILDLPHFGGDVFRALPLLPGASANDITAQFHVRGGRRDEVLVLLDGQELYQAYHLTDFDNATSIVPSGVLDRLSLSTGAFPASHGDRMGGVLDMASLAPPSASRLEIQASVLDLRLAASSAAPDPAAPQRLAWFVSARRGTADLAADIFDRRDPAYWDLFARLDGAAGPRQTFRLSVLGASDRLGFEENQHGELTRLDTAYDSRYTWLTHQLLASDRLFVDTVLSVSRVERDRRGLEDEEEKRFLVDDRRRLEVLGVLQSWNLQAGQRHFLTAGIDLRRFDAVYDYASDRTFHDPLVALRAEPRDGVFDFRARLRDDYLAAHLGDRFTPLEALTLDLGARFDRHSLSRDEVVSPRGGLAWRVGSNDTLRLGWGHYHQSQRAYELAVEDGDTALHRAERAEHRVLGLEHRFGGDWLRAARLELYERLVRHPRPRYESLYEPYEAFPEGELDRYRVEPQRSRASGVELLVLGAPLGRFSWWASYTWARSEDRIAGRWVPRQVDQRHALTLDLGLRLGRHWNVDLAWRFHTGWPTTPITIVEQTDEDGETELVPQLGPLNSRRLPAYHRLDLRLRRSWPRPNGTLTGFIDVQNLYDRRNVAGYDLDFDEDAGTISASEEPWPGLFASAGVTWRF